MTKERFLKLEPAIQKRVRIERAIARRVVKDALAAGWTLTVDYGDGEPPVENSVRADNVMAALMECDEEYLILRRPAKADGKIQRGWVRFIYGNGNNGCDVVCDHSTNVDDVMDGAMKLAERLEARAR